MSSLCLPRAGVVVRTLSASAPLHSGTKLDMPLLIQKKIDGTSLEVDEVVGFIEAVVKEEVKQTNM